MSAMTKSHRVLVSVRFDRPCTDDEAVAAVRETVHGEFYPSLTRDKAPETFRIRSVSRAPKREALR